MDDFAGEEGRCGSPTGRAVTVAGIVVSSKTTPTKNNSLMAYVMVEDETAAIELLCFSRTIDQCGSYHGGEYAGAGKGPAVRSGRKAAQIMCDSIYPLEQGVPIPETAGPPKEKTVIYLKVPGADDREFRHISLVMTMFEGDTPLKVRLADTGKNAGYDVPAPSGVPAGVPGVAG